jgi:hypothetical protein
MKYFIILLSFTFLFIFFSYKSTRALYQKDIEAFKLLKAEEITGGNSDRIYLEAGEIITEKHLAGLPRVFQAYLRKTGVIGQRMPRQVILKQIGQIRTAEDQNWMQFQAEESYNPIAHSFAWYAHVSMNPFVFLKGRDTWIEAKGHMQIKIWDLFSVVNARGEEIDQGAAMRYLNEIMWFPAAYLQRGFHFWELEGNRIGVELAFQDERFEAELHFDEEYRLFNFTGLRYMDSKENGFQLETWETPIDEWEYFNNLLLPSGGSAVWKYDGKEFEYIRLRIHDLLYVF